MQGALDTWTSLKDKGVLDLKAKRGGNARCSSTFQMSNTPPTYLYHQILAKFKNGPQIGLQTGK